MRVTTVGPTRRVSSEMPYIPTERRSSYDVKVGRVGPKELCGGCKAGDHKTGHREIGCLNSIDAPPRDYVCKCVVARQ
jgi:hypothetical protein